MGKRLTKEEIAELKAAALARKVSKGEIESNLYHDNFQNSKSYHIPHAQLIIADIPYNIGVDAYGSNPSWYEGGDRKNGESDKAGSNFFRKDELFNSAEFMHFASRMLVKEPKEKGKAPCMIIFCSFEQQFGLIELGKRHGFPNYINLVFRKNFSPQVLKANMRVVGNAEYAILFYRKKLPKFNNGGKMVFNIMDWVKDKASDPFYEKIHPTQKPLRVLERLIEIFTDPGDVVVDPTAGSGSALVAANNLGRLGYGFENDRKFYPKANAWIMRNKKMRQEIRDIGFSPSLLSEQNDGQQSLFS